ncbi:hypothetical protein DFH07DRAFT_931453 [Mycena maculata]|uniref:Uncharacterized protein n=1 Tax=Mycena maculata TaxID=230809 RepID=A0AAD7MPS4_9AGAR|nr:hypothetical protein DFH07DRAFT_931453 [Mycena maculata]
MKWRTARKCTHWHESAAWRACILIMIIDVLDERTALKTVHGHPPSHDSLEAGLPPSPPPYVSYQAIPPPVVARRKSGHRKHRFRHRYLVAVSVVFNCLLVVLLIRVLRRDDDSGSRKQGDTAPAPEPEQPIPSPTLRLAVVPDPHIGRCIRNAIWSNATRLSTEDLFPFSSDATFHFPDSSSPMFLLSLGALSGGIMNVQPSSESVPYVHLSVRYHSLHVLDRTNVCWMERNQSNAAGVGIFTPAPFDGQASTDELDFTITLFLPTNSSASTSPPMYNLETHLPSFTHTLDFLRGVVEFDNLVLRSQGKPVIVQSLFARNATIHTSNGFISGSFDTSGSLSLVTSNAPIYADVQLHNTNIFSTTELVLQTRNAQLESAVSLFTSAATGEGGKFAVNAHTADGPLVLSFPVSPTHSVLSLEAQTSNSPADVWLNHAFEGDFALASNMVVVDRRPFLDPRKLRTVFYGDFKNGRVVGNVQWKLPIWKSRIPGLVRVATTNHILKFYV